MKRALFLTFDKLSLRFLGCYGNAGGFTPAFDRFAAESVVFDNHFVENVDPAARNHAWNTGRFQFPQAPQAQDGENTLSQALTAQGVIVNEFTDATSPADLFDDVVECIRGVGNDATRGCLLRLRLQGPAESPDDADDRDADYAESLSALDAQFGRFWKSAHDSATAVGDDLLVIVSASQGVDLGEQPHLPETIRGLGDAIVHTPLLVYATDGETGTRRMALVQSIDVVPTLMDWFAIPIDGAAFDGRSLLPLVRGQREAMTADERRFAFSGNGRAATGIRDAESYLIIPPQSGDDLRDTQPPMLFAKPDDVWEIHDIAAQNPHTVEELQRQFTEFLQSRSAPA